MSSVKSSKSKDEYVYIDLDDPSRWWQTLIGVIAVVLIATVLVAPWAIDLDDDQPEVVANATLQNTGSVCRPNASGLPSIFDPSVASWSRFCEWFIDPQVNPPGEP